MPWVVVGSLAASVVSFIISNVTSKPAITIEQAQVSTQAERELTFFKWGFFALTGLIAVKLLKGGK